MKEMLNRFVDNIESQKIRLIKLDFNANDKIGGIFIGSKIDLTLNIKLPKIGEGQEISNNKTKDILTAVFDFELLYSENNKDNNHNKKLASLKARYNITLVLKEEIDKLFTEEEKRKVVPIFFDNSGRVMVYPYFRNLVDILTREAGFVFEPIPPLKINNK